MPKYHKGYSKNYTQFWETCEKGFAHLEGERITTPRSLETYLTRTAKWYGYPGPDEVKSFLANKTVVDYGIGNGRLGVTLTELGCYYIGIDIAERQLKEARKLFAEYNCKNWKLKQTPVEFASLKAQVFVSEACIQHFPNRPYFKGFMANLNRSGIETLMLQTRTSKGKSEFREDCPVWSCKVSVGYVQQFLTKYELVHKSNNTQYDYRFTRWELK